MKFKTPGAEKVFSASKIQTWMGCPLQAKFRYVDKLTDDRVNASASFGNCVHSALQNYNKNDSIEDALAYFIHVWEHPDIIGATPTEWSKNTNYASLRDRGIKMLKEYHDKCRWQKRRVIATEHEFLVPFGDFYLYGYVDLVELKLGSTGEQELRVVDYKTNKKQPYINALQWNTQFTVYSYAAAQPEFYIGTLDTPPVADGERVWYEVEDLQPLPIWYHLETSKEIFAGPRGDDDFMRLHRVVTEIQKAQDRSVYVPNVSGDTCTFCPYKEPCGLPIVQKVAGEFWLT